jgi:hypothetical protein
MVIRSRQPVANAMIAQYERLDAYCEGCRHKVQIPWPLIRRPPDTPLADLAGSLTCGAMRPTAENPRCQPPARRFGLRKSPALMPIEHHATLVDAA